MQFIQNDIINVCYAEVTCDAQLGLAYHQADKAGKMVLWPELLTKSMLKPMLAKKDFLTHVLIGWQLCCSYLVHAC